MFYRKILKILSFILLLLLGLVIVVILTINLPFARKFLQGFANRKLQSSAIPVQIGALNTIRLGEISISDILIATDPRDTILFIGNLDIRFAPRSLLNRTINLQSVVAQTVITRLLQDAPDQPLNLIRAFAKDKPEKPETDTSKWKFNISELRLSSVDFSYHSIPGQLLMTLGLAKADIVINKMDLAGKLIAVDDMFFDQVRAKMFTGVKQSGSDTASGFNFPWNIQVSGIRFADGSFTSGTYQRQSEISLIPKIVFSAFHTELSDIAIKPEHIALKIRNTGFQVDNGFTLRAFNGELQSRPTGTLFDFHIITGHSELKASGRSDTIVFELAGNESESEFSVGTSHIDLSDLLYFDPDIRNADWYKKYGLNPVTVNAKVIQSRRLTRIDTLSIYQSNDLWLSLEGIISNLADNSIRKDYNLNLMSSMGDIRLDGNINLVDEILNVKANLSDLTPGSIIDQNVIQVLNGSLTAGVKGFNPDKMHSRFRIHLNNSRINNHAYDQIMLEGDVTPGYSNVSANINDPAINLGLATSIIRRENELSLQTHGTFRLSPAELGLLKDSLSIAAGISGDLRKMGDSLEATVELADIELTEQSGKTQINGLQVNLRSDSLQTSLTGSSDFFNMKFESANPVSASGEMIAAMSGYFRALAKNYFLDSAFHQFDIPMASLDAQFNYHPVLTMFTNDTTLNFSEVNLHVSSGKHSGQFIASIQASGIQAGKMSVGRFETHMNDSSGVIQVTAFADSISAGSQFFSELKFSHLSNDSTNQGQTELLITETDQVNTELKIASLLDDSVLTVSIPSQQILLNGVEWQTGTPGLFSYHPGKGEFLPQITLYTDSSELKLVTVKEGQESGFDVVFDHVSVASLLPATLIPGNPVADIYGIVRYRSHAENLSIDADINLRQVGWSDLNLAHVGIIGSYQSSGEKISRGESRITLDSAEIRAEYTSLSPGKRSVKAVFSALPLNIIKPFIEESVSELSGTVSGEINMEPGSDKELFSGNIDLNNIGAHVTSLNSSFRIPQEKIILSGNRIEFDRFRIVDVRNNELFVNGTIDFSPGKTARADLNISSPELLVMNSTREDNQSFYGTILVGTDLSAVGPLNAPAVKGNLSLNDGTEVYYTSQTSYQLQDMTKTVTFIDTDSQDSVETDMSDNQNLTIGATVEADPSTIIHFSLIDQLYAINLEIKGGGTLNYTIFSNKQSNLTGLYEISEGNADVKMKGFPNKNFTISEGSFVRWIDKMDDPELQIEAQNKVTGRYKSPADGSNRIVEFNVLLRLKNRMSALDVLFTVSTEDQYLMSIINAMSPEEQMKQAVSLLLFQTINIPGIYTTSNQVTDQVNQIVESQLNKLTQTSIKDIDISLGLDSYTTPSENGAEETQTSLSYDIQKDLLDNRASIEVSGRLNNPGETGIEDNSVSSFTFEYQLDSAGTKYFQVFRQRSYEDVLEGEVERTGLGIILRKTFDSIKDIFSKRNDP